jgi:hypothetical protein
MPYLLAMSNTPPDATESLATKLKNRPITGRFSPLSPSASTKKVHSLVTICCAVNIRASDRKKTSGSHSLLFHRLFKTPLIRKTKHAHA